MKNSPLSQKNTYWTLIANSQSPHITIHVLVEMKPSTSFHFHFKTIAQLMLKMSHNFHAPNPWGNLVHNSLAWLVSGRNRSLVHHVSCGVFKCGRFYSYDVYRCLTVIFLPVNRTQLCVLLCVVNNVTHTDSCGFPN